MAVRNIKPATNAKRGTSYLDFSILTKGKTPKSLRKINKKNAGRNNSGRLTVAHRGGGSKRFYREVNFLFNDERKAKVVSVDYDPNRKANIAQIKYDDGKLDYIIAPDKLKTGEVIESGKKASIKKGNRKILKDIPIGMQIHNIELRPNLGGKICRSAGNYATVLATEGKFAQIKLPSGEVRRLRSDCWASIGIVGNTDVMNISIGKAGRRRHMGFRPVVRGKAKNVVDHPHGGGEGGTSIGMPHPKTPWGLPTLGYKTRNRKKKSSKEIIKSRRQ